MYITIYWHWTYTLTNDFFMQISWDPDLHMAIKSGMVKRGVLLSVCTVDIYFQKTTTNRKIKHFRDSKVNYEKISRVFVFIQQLSIDLQVQYQYTIHTITTESLQFNYILIYICNTLKNILQFETYLLIMIDLENELPGIILRWYMGHLLILMYIKVCYHSKYFHQFRKIKFRNIW